MNILHYLILLIGLIASGITFALMRFPQTRRPQFRTMGQFSIAASLLGALIVLAAFVTIAFTQG